MADPFRSYNVEAVFSDRSTAEAAAGAVRSETGASVTMQGEDATAAVRAEMRDELEASVVGAGNVGPFTKGMTRGLAKWVPILTLAGAAVGALFALIPWGFTLGLRMLISVMIGVFAGATTGFVIGGAFRPRTEHEGEEMAAERGITVGVHSDDAAEVERAETVLARFGPDRIDRVDRRGSPLGKGPREHTRPVRGPVPTAPEDTEDDEEDRPER